MRQQNNKDVSLDKQHAHHYKIITSALLFLIVSQLIIYLFLNHYAESSQKTIEQLLKTIPKFTLQVNPLQQFNENYNLDVLSSTFDEINQQIIQMTKKDEFNKLYNSTLDQLQMTQSTLNQLKKQIQQIEETASSKQEIVQQYLGQSYNQYRFVFPKQIWIFEQLKQGYFQKMNQLYIENIKRVSQQNGYPIQFINHYNYAKFVRRSRMIMVTQTLQTLKARMDSQTQPLLTQSVYFQIKRTLIMLLVLQQNGGVMISKYFAMVQSLDWLRTITLNKFINRGQKSMLPKVFGFYNISRSSARMQMNRTSDNRFKFLIKYPGINPYFLVAVKGSQFIHDVLNSICSLLQNPTQYLSSSQKLKKDKKTQFLYFISHNKIYDQFFQIATMNVLLNKQTSMKGKAMIGLDYYGLVTMNANYGPQKASFFFQNNQGLKILKHLSHFHLSQFQAQIGKVRYINRLPSYYELNDYVNNLTAYQDILIKGSYFHQFLYPHTEEKFLIQRVEVAKVQQNAQPWIKLPKLIWVYWHYGLQNSNIIYQLCADNLRRYGLQSGFQINIVSDSNINEFLSTEAIQKIQYAVSHQASIVKSKYIRYDLIRLALVAEHGGIYMDLSYILLQNLDWLVNIAKYPSNYIFNRYGSNPKVFMFFHPHYGSPFNWTVNPHINSKIAWLLGYQNNFIAAQKKSELIIEWFQQLVRAIQTPYQDIEKEYIRCNVYAQRWTSFNDIYLLSMDTIKYIIGRKQTDLQQKKNTQYWDASDYYKLWSMNGYLGQQKFRSHTSYDTNNHDNLFLRLFSQEDAEEMVGRTFHLTKLYNYPVKFLYSNFMANYQHLDLQFHEQSIFMKYVYNSSRHSMQKYGKNGQQQKLIIKQ